MGTKIDQLNNYKAKHIEKIKKLDQQIKQLKSIKIQKKIKDIDIKIDKINKTLNDLNVEKLNLINQLSEKKLMTPSIKTTMDINYEIILKKYIPPYELFSLEDIVKKLSNDKKFTLPINKHVTIESFVIKYLEEFCKKGKIKQIKENVYQSLD